MKVSSVVDWLEFTRTGSLCSPQEFAPSGDGWVIEEVVNPLPHYPYVAKTVNGSLVMRGVSAKQGMRMIISGDPMREFRLSGGDDLQLVKFAHREMRRPTRIDLTLDLVGSDAPRPEAFTEAINAGDTVTRARSFEYHGQNARDGYTQYIGSEKSDKRGRIYDYRAKHLNVLFEAWTRCELQLSQDYARAAAQDAMRHGIHAAASTWWREFCDFPTIVEFQEAIRAGVDVEPQAVPRKVTNWEKWLMGTVLASCEKNAATHNRSVIEDFTEALIELLDQTSDHEGDS